MYTVAFAAINKQNIQVPYYCYVVMQICFMQGVNLHRIPESDYSVTVGGQPCTELEVNEAGTAITCFPPVLTQIYAPVVVS